MFITFVSFYIILILVRNAQPCNKTPQTIQFEMAASFTAEVFSVRSHERQNNQKSGHLSLTFTHHLTPVTSLKPLFTSTSSSAKWALLMQTYFTVLKLNQLMFVKCFEINMVLLLMYSKSHLCSYLLLEARQGGFHCSTSSTILRSSSAVRALI